MTKPLVKPEPTQPLQEQVLVLEQVLIPVLVLVMIPRLTMVVQLADLLLVVAALQIPVLKIAPTNQVALTMLTTLVTLKPVMLETATLVTHPLVLQVPTHLISPATRFLQSIRPN